MSTTELLAELMTLAEKLRAQGEDETATTKWEDVDRLLELLFILHELLADGSTLPAQWQDPSPYD